MPPGLPEWKVMPLCLIESCQFYFINLSHLFWIQINFRHSHCLVAATHMRKYFYGLLLNCYLLVLFDGINIVEFLFISPTLCYCFFIDICHILSSVTSPRWGVLLCLAFHYHWSSLLSVSVSFPVLLYSFGDKGTLNCIKDTWGI